MPGAQIENATMPSGVTGAAAARPVRRGLRRDVPGPAVAGPHRHRQDPSRHPLPAAAEDVLPRVRACPIGAPTPRLGERGLPNVRSMYTELEGVPVSVT